MLFLRFTPDRKAEVIEASPGACNGRVCRNVYPLASVLARGYAPVRFRGLANETVANVSLPGGAAAEGARPRRAKPRRRKRAMTHFATGTLRLSVGPDTLVLGMRAAFGHGRGLCRLESEDDVRQRLMQAMSNPGALEALRSFWARLSLRHAPA